VKLYQATAKTSLLQQKIHYVWTLSEQTCMQTANRYIQSWCWHCVSYDAFTHVNYMHLLRNFILFHDLVLSPISQHSVWSEITSHNTLHWSMIRYDTIRYDSVYLTCSKKLTGSQLRPPHGTNKKLTCETKNKMMSVMMSTTKREQFIALFVGSCWP